MTPLAKLILQVVKASPHPIGAYDIAAQLARQSRKAVHANSVYRCLADLGRLGHVHQLASTKGFVAVPTSDGKMLIWLICTNCNTTLCVSDSGCHQALLCAAYEHGFCASNSIIEVRGQCYICQMEIRTASQPPPQ
jgi:Fur family transcriptional regulator, zinc uptake regulator